MSAPLVSVCVPRATTRASSARRSRARSRQGSTELEVLVHDDASSGRDGVGASGSRATGACVLRHARRGSGWQRNREQPGEGRTRSSSGLARRRRRVLAGGLARQVEVLEAQPGRRRSCTARGDRRRGRRAARDRADARSSTTRSSRLRSRPGAHPRERAVDLDGGRPARRADAGRAVRSPGGRAAPTGTCGCGWRSRAPWRTGDAGRALPPAPPPRSPRATTAAGRGFAATRTSSAACCGPSAGRLRGPGAGGGRAHAALAAKALRLAGDLATRGERAAAARAAGLAARLAPRPARRRPGRG